MKLPFKVVCPYCFKITTVLSEVVVDDRYIDDNIYECCHCNRMLSIEDNTIEKTIIFNRENFALQTRTKYNEDDDILKLDIIIYTDILSEERITNQDSVYIEEYSNKEDHTEEILKYIYDIFADHQIEIIQLTTNLSKVICYNRERFREDVFG